MMGHPIVEYIVPVVIGLIFSVFNFSALSIILCDRKLRSKLSTYPIFSFLIVSTLQGIFVAPIYTFRKLHGGSDIPHGALPGWICDASRSTYIVCHHIMTASLLLVTLNRVLDIWYPYTLQNESSRKKMIFIIACMWVTTIVVDMVPFLNATTTSHCMYRPQRTWGLIVIIVYDIIPCVLIILNCLLIWTVAYRAHSVDTRRASSMKRSTNLMVPSPIKYSQQERLKKKRACGATSRFKMALDMKATVTSFVIIIIYVICWGPLGIFYMIDHFCHNCLSRRSVKRSLATTKLVIRFLYYSSSIWTPLAYCWLNKEFRKSGWKLLRKLSSLNGDGRQSVSNKTYLTVQTSKERVRLTSVQSEYSL